MLKHALSTAPKGNPELMLKTIDEHCRKYRMIHVGDEKGEIVKDALKKWQPKTILELGCYCGYSSLMMAHFSKAVVHTF